MLLHAEKIGCRGNFGESDTPVLSGVDADFLVVSANSELGTESPNFFIVWHVYSEPA
jgi:hypothetical protein